MNRFALQIDHLRYQFNAGLYRYWMFYKDSPFAKRYNRKKLQYGAITNVEAYPVGALSGGEKINKKLCGDRIFRHGFRYFQKVMQGMKDGPTDELRQIKLSHSKRHGD